MKGILKHLKDKLLSKDITQIFFEINNLCMNIDEDSLMKIVFNVRIRSTLIEKLKIEFLKKIKK
jgi:hypothetical protein